MQGVQGLFLQALEGSAIEGASQTANDITQQLAGNWQILVIGFILIISTVLILIHLKKIIVNSALGLIAWAVMVFVLKIELQLIPTIVISAIFGLAGVGVILILKFFNMPI